MGRKRNKHPKSKVSNEESLKIGTFFETINSKESLAASEFNQNNRLNICNLSNETGIPTTHSEGTGIGFLAYNGKSERLTGREYFVHSLCQVCKAELTESVPVPCPKCELVRYCSQEHRRQHWPVHADLCAAVQAVCQERGVAHLMQGAAHLPPDKFRLFRFQNMVDCENRVERPLEKWEKEMFIFPNVCETCHQYGATDLVVCNRCRHSGFCERHRSGNHDTWCEHVLQYKNAVKDQCKFGIVCPSIPISKIHSFFPNISDINCVFEPILTENDQFEFLEITEITTYPLTALNALVTLSTQPHRPLKKVTLHIIGAEPDFEANKLEKWEYYVLHLIPTLQSLEIEFIGPELNTTIKPGSFKVCSHCLAAGKSIMFRSHNELYHRVCASGRLSKPTLVCAFNPGLYRSTGFNNEDTWTPSIASMFASNVPVLITAYTNKEIFLDVDRVKTIEKVRLEKGPSQNPFSSLKPNLNFVSDEDSPVIFKNQFYCIVNKL